MPGPQYEILTVTLPDDDAEGELAAYGLDGWSLVNGQLFNCGECGTLHERVWLQRRLIEQPSDRTDGDLPFE